MLVEFWVRVAWGQDGISVWEYSNMNYFAIGGFGLIS